MLTTNFLKMITTLGQSTTGIKIDGTEATMSFPVYTDGQKQRTYGYTQPESTYLFTKETATVSDLGISNKNHAYSEQNIDVYNAFYTSSSSSSTVYYSNTIAMLVGTGNTAATKDDYKLVSQVELESGVDSATMDAEHGMLRVVREFINNTGSNVIITEVGMYNVSISKSSSSAWTVHTFLIGREVLSESVTIEPGKSCTFTFTVDMNSVAGTT